eukprot:EG_transcript_23646
MAGGKGASGGQSHPPPVRNSDIPRSSVEAPSRTTSGTGPPPPPPVRHSEPPRGSVEPPPRTRTASDWKFRRALQLSADLCADLELCKSVLELTGYDRDAAANLLMDSFGVVPAPTPVVSTPASSPMPPATPAQPSAPQLPAAPVPAVAPKPPATPLPASVAKPPAPPVPAAASHSSPGPREPTDLGSEPPFLSTH